MYYSGLQPEVHSTLLRSSGAKPNIKGGASQNMCWEAFGNPQLIKGGTCQLILL